MRKLYLLLFLFAMNQSFAEAQTTWEKLFSSLSTHAFRCVKEVPAGGFIAAGYSANFTANDTDAYAVRLDNNGDTIWTFTYNGPMSKKDLFYKVICTSDGGFVFCGYTNSVTGLLDDAMYMKLNSSGQMQWVKFYGGNGKERAQDIIQTADGGYAAVGYTTTSPAQYFDGVFIKLTSNGDTSYTRRFGSSQYDDANVVRQLSDGGYIIGGQSWSINTNSYDFYLVRLGPTGSVYWSQRFGSPGTDNIESLVVLSSGFIIAGSTSPSGAGDDGYIAKTDTGGVVIWNRVYGGSMPDDFHRIERTSDGGYIATGTTSSSGPLYPNIWVMKTNSTGDSLWARTFGGANHDHGYSAQETSDGGYIIAGYSGSFGFNYEEGYLIKTDVNGNVSNHLTYTTVLDIISPTSLTCGSASTPIKIVLRNFGNQSIANFPVTVEISGAQSMVIPQTFSAGSDTVTLSTTLNTSAGGTFTIKCYTDNDNDVYPKRNFILRTFTINVTPSAPTATDNSRCGPGSLTLDASATTPIYWFTVPAGGTSIFTGAQYNTPSLSGTTTYYVQTGTTCPSARIAVIATVNPLSADPITTNVSRCGSGTVTLTASATDPISWYDASTGGNLVGNGPSFLTPVLISTTDYYAQASNGICPSSRIVATASINSTPADPIATDGGRCGPGTVSLSVTSSVPVLWFDASSGGTQIHVGTTYTTPNLNSTTTYYAEADNGCQSNRVPVVANIYTPPTVNLGPDTLVNGSSYLIDAGAGTYTYAWSNGATTQSINVNVADTYCVTITDVNSCSASDCVVVDLATGISSSLEGNRIFNAYPNPSSGEFYIDVKSIESKGIIEIMNMTGEIILRKNLNTGIQTVGVDISGFAKGIYILRLYTGSIASSQRLVVE